MGDFSVIFESVPDPRDINARHDLRDMLFIALAAMLCGAESCVEMAEFGGEKEALLRTILELKNGLNRAMSIMRNRTHRSEPIEPHIIRLDVFRAHAGAHADGAADAL